MAKWIGKDRHSAESSHQVVMCSMKRNKMIVDDENLRGKLPQARAFLYWKWNGLG